MRAKRILVQGASWYEVRTAVNNHEPLFRRRQAVAIFCRVFGEVRKRFACEIRGFRLDGERLSFYIKPENGLQLPAIMQWVKQTFAVRFNLSEDRTGHVWGDRYWSKVLEGEPPEGAKEVDWAAVAVGAETGVLPSGARASDGVSPLVAKPPAESGFSPQTPARPPPPPG
jgi:REP element-mobilizing transposase RayT